MPIRRDQSERDMLVRSVARYVKEQGHSDIKVNLFGYDTPDQIYWETTKQGHTPDVTSTNIKHFIIDVETDGLINEPNTEDRWRLFSANARQQSKLFIVAVPKGSEQPTRQRALDSGIKLDDVWIVD
ncbi:MAG: hypothetical protein AABZ77_00650 [Chloroflexota bacterium]